MDTETLFWIAAVAGSGFFIVKVAMGLVFGLDHAGHGAADIHLHDAGGTEDAFKIFSFYSISAFLMMFGWSGLAGMHQLELGVGLSTVLGLVVGAVVMWLTARFFGAMKKLTSTGAQFKIEELPGLRGSVYQRIPGGEGKGVIQVTVQGMTREVEAISETGVALESFTPVEVKRVVGAGLVSVVSAK
jgi:hypothetical protein